MKFLFASITIISLVLIFSNCGDSSQDKELPTHITPAVMSKGLSLLQQNCFTCHSPDANLENRLAPPMVAVKEHYMGKKITEEAFIESIMKFMKDPKEEDTKMPGAIKKFSLMPKMAFPDEQLKTMATYLYYANMEKPDWYAEHRDEERKNYEQSLTPEEKVFLKKGQEYAMATKSVLGKNLMGALNKKGTDGALTFCSERAITLTDSMQNHLGVGIKRVSDQYRNPDNTADLNELQYILQSKNQMKQGGEAIPKVFSKGKKMVGYYPITTNQMCLQCHGKKDKNILSTTQDKLSELYPEDKAFGYDINELRGIWVVEMPKEEH
ncbi:MAG: DUF3365 domain-containing protein [Saprospiraceae bacterium]|nr:DUF3365 domain-containing protein [Saprospiraceae bacterium]